MTLPLQIGPAWGTVGAFNDTNVRGTALNSGASLNTKGSWTQLVASVPFDCCGFYLSWMVDGSADYLFDLGVGGSGSEVALVPNLQACARNVDRSANGVYFPISIKAGQRLSFRVQATSSSQTIWVGITLFRGGPNVPSAQKVVQYGTIATSKGVAVAGSSSANTFGSWTQIVAATAEDVAGLLVGLGQNGGTKSNTNQRWQIGVGASGSEQVALEFGTAVLTGNGYIFDRGVGMGILPVRIKSGQRIAARVMNVSAIATAANRTYDVVLHGIVP